MEMKFTNVQNVKKQIEDNRERLPLKENIYVCDILKFLDEHCDHAIDIESETFANVKGMSYGFEKFEAHNNGTYAGNSTELIQYNIYDADWNFFVAMSFGIRTLAGVVYTPFVMFCFENYDDFWDALNQVYILETEDFSASISTSALMEDNDVYVNYINSNGEEDSFDFTTYAIEKDDMIDSIQNRISKLKQVSTN